MADIPAASPVSPASSATTTGGNNIVVEAAVNNVPDKIAMLSRQIEVSGTLAGTPAGNSVTLNTVIGPLVLLLPQLAAAQQDKLLQQLVTLFQNQRPLTVVLQPGNPPSQAFLLLPPATPATQYQSNAANFLQSSFQTSVLTQNAQPLVPNFVLSAIVLPRGVTIPAAPQQTFPGQVAPLPYAPLNPNAIFGDAAPEPTKILTAADAFGNLAKLGQGAQSQSLSQPQVPVIPSLPNIPNALTAEAFQTEAPALPGAGGAISLQPGMEVSLRIDMVILPSQQDVPSPPLPALGTNQIVVTVTGNAPGGQGILKAGDATLFVRQPVDAPAGTQLVVTVEPSQQNAAAYVTTTDPQFAALQQIMSAMSQADPVAAHQIFANRMPQPGEAMPGAILFFLSAIRQGDVRSWLGNNALDMLSRIGRAELIAKFAQEMQQAAQTSHDNAVGEWRTYPLPMQDHGQLSALYFHVHGEKRHHQGLDKDKEGESGARPSQMRFLIDVRMSRLGPLQLDGFLRAKQLDMIVRSENALPPWLNQELRDSYSRTMNAIGYTGGISFQNGRQGWLTVQPPAAGKEMVT